MSLFAVRLKESREKSGRTQMDFAADLGIDHTSVSLYETGRRMPKLETIVRMCKLLGC